MLEVWLAFLATGVAAGLMSGLLGVGGGLVIVPALAWLLPRLGVPAEYAMHMAVGTSLASIVFTNASSTLAHHQRRAVRWRVVMRLSGGIVAGALIGAYIADALPADWLEAVFAGFALLMGLRLLIGGKPAPHREVPGGGILAVVGVPIGVISALVGIGGGSLTAPYLMWCNLRAQQAVACAAACGLPLAFAGAVGFIFTGWHEAGLPQATLGYVYLPALAGIVLASVFTAPLGARLAHALPTDTLRQVFGLMLLILGALMAWP